MNKKENKEEKVLGIIGAMEEEVEILKGKMDVKDTVEVAGMTFYSGKLHDKNVVLVRSGVGKVNMASCTQILADKFNFPLSNYTQIFMICIMFGIGTDYSILLLNRFKEELANGNNRLDSVKTTFKTAGKTVLSSATPVFVVFASLNFIEIGRAHV